MLNSPTQYHGYSNGTACNKNGQKISVFLKKIFWSLIVRSTSRS